MTPHTHADAHSPNHTHASSVGRITARMVTTICVTVCHPRALEDSGSKRLLVRLSGAGDKSLYRLWFIYP